MEKEKWRWKNGKFMTRPHGHAPFQDNERTESLVWNELIRFIRFVRILNEFLDQLKRGVASPEEGRGLCLKMKEIASKQEKNFVFCIKMKNYKTEVYETVYEAFPEIFEGVRRRMF